MSESVHLSNRMRNRIVIALAAFYVAICAFCILTTRSWIGRTFPGFLVLRNNHNSTFFRQGWEGNRQGLRNLDLVRSANGTALQDGDELYRYVAGLAPGTPVTYQIIRGKEILTKTIPTATFTPADYIFCFPLAMLVGALFYFPGLMVVFLKPKSAANWYFFMAFGALALLFATNGERVTNHHIFFPTLVPALSAASLLLFALHFPAPVKHSRSITLVIFAPLLAIMLLYTRAYFSGANFSGLDRISLVFTLFSYAGSVYLQVRSYLSSRDPVIRQKVKIVIFGFIAGLFSFIYIFSVFMMTRTMNLYYTAYHGAVIPICLGYAILARGLFDMSVFLRRTISYLLASGILVIAFLALSFGISVGLQNFVHQSSQIAAVIATLLAVMMFRPLYTRIDRSLDKRFFRERYEYSDTIRKASHILISIIDLNQLLSQLLNTVVDAIKIERGLIYLREPDRAEFLPRVANGYPGSLPPPIISGDPLAGFLEHYARPFQITDLEPLQETGAAAEQIEQFLRSAGLILMIPIIYEQRLIGILGLGEKKSGAFYSREDLELLSTLMIQTAVSIENASKVEELKKMVALEASYKELKQLDQLKDNFLSMVSHDLRTPMTSIQGYTSILIEKMDRLDPGRRKHYLEIIHKESLRLTRLINNLLDLQRFEAGKMNLEFQEIELGKIVREIGDSFQGAALVKSQRLEIIGPDQGLRIRGDADRLSQVVANLLSNAVKFTPEGGRITVRVERIQAEGKALAKVSVADSGPGIPAELQAKVFDKFQQLEHPVKPEEKGSGLGLALVREIVEHHGGKVGVESEPGRGATFYFTLAAAG